MWRAEAGADDASTWITLIEECPWDAADRALRGRAPIASCGPSTRGAAPTKRQAELADSDVQGPWRELIDAVREAGTPVPREQP